MKICICAQPWTLHSVAPHLKSAFDFKWIWLFLISGSGCKYIDLFRNSVEPSIFGSGRRKKHKFVNGECMRRLIWRRGQNAGLIKSSYATWFPCHRSVMSPAWPALGYEPGFNYRRAGRSLESQTYTPKNKDAPKGLPEQCHRRTFQLMLVEFVLNWKVH